MQQQTQRGMPKAEDVPVFIVTQDARCEECGTSLPSGSFLRVEDKTALCLDCADLGELEFLPSGDAALTVDVDDEPEAARALLHFEDAEKEPMPRMLRTTTWEAMKSYFEVAIPKYVKAHLKR